MALFKISKGSQTNLPSSYNEGWCYVTTDTHKMYIDSTNNENGRFALNAAAADVAERLSINAGSSLQPVYFLQGQPKAFSDSLGSSSVPVYLAEGKFVASSYDFKNFLPKAGGAENKMTGMLGLTQGACYGSEAPLEGTFDGALYLVEDEGYSLASSNVAGLIKIGYSGSNNKNYAIQLNEDGQAYVSVPLLETTKGGKRAISFDSDILIVPEGCYGENLPDSGTQGQIFWVLQS